MTDFAQLTAQRDELTAALHEILGGPDQADLPASLGSALSGRRGLQTMTQVSGLAADLAAVQRQLAAADARRAQTAEAQHLTRRKAARDAARELAPQHREIAHRTAEAALALVAAAEDEAKLHDGLRREFGAAPLPRLAAFDLGPLRAMAAKAGAYAAGEA